MQAFYRQFAGGFFLLFADGFVMVLIKSKRPLDVHIHEGPVSGRDYLRSLIIPFVAEISGKKTGKKNNTQYCHKYVHIAQHDGPPFIC